MLSPLIHLLPLTLAYSFFNDAFGISDNNLVIRQATAVQ